MGRLMAQGSRLKAQGSRLNSHAYENVGRFHATHFKTLNHFEESIKVFFLSKSTETLLNFENNLAIIIWYKKQPT